MSVLTARPAIATLLAVLFGLVQIVCACAQPASDMSPAESAVTMTHKMESMPSMDMGGHCGEGAPEQDDHAADCAHCGAVQLTSVAVDQSFSAVPDMPTAKAMPAAIPVAASLPEQALAPERFRRRSDPPRQTPVTLKLRLLV